MRKLGMLPSAKRAFCSPRADAECNCRRIDAIARREARGQPGSAATFRTQSRSSFDGGRIHTHDPKKPSKPSRFAILNVRFVEGRPHLFNAITRSIEGLAGAVLIALAIHEIFLR
jgi:hypothetical protein